MTIRPVPETCCAEKCSRDVVKKHPTLYAGLVKKRVVGGVDLLKISTETRCKSSLKACESFLKIVDEEGVDVGWISLDALFLP